MPLGAAWSITTSAPWTTSPRPSPKTSTSFPASCWRSSRVTLSRSGERNTGGTSDHDGEDPTPDGAEGAGGKVEYSRPRVRARVGRAEQGRRGRQQGPAGALQEEHPRRRRRGRQPAQAPARGDRPPQDG